MLLLIPILFFFIGCSRQPEIKVVYKERLVKLTPPTNFTVDDIDVPKPPNKLSYTISSPFQRETMLVNYTIDLLKTIKLYKLKLKALREWEKNVNKENR